MQKQKPLMFGGLIVLGVTCFMSFFCYKNLPIGDDVLTYFEGALTAYLDEFTYTPGERITSVSQVVKEVGFAYRYWSGRMPGYTILFLGKLFPKLVQAAATAVLYSANVFLALQILCKDAKKALSSSLSFLVLFLALYWFRPSQFYTYMWTMVSIYSSSVFLCLLYYKISVVDEKSDMTHRRWIQYGIGFLAWFSHEVISLCMITAVGIHWLAATMQKKQKWTTLVRHAGLFAGYVFCFFAPGNFYRLGQSHDVIDTSLAKRLSASVNIHIKILTGTREAEILFFATLFLAFLAAGILLVKKDRETIAKICLDNAGFAGGGVISILVWALFSGVPEYGLDLWIVMVYLMLFSVIRTIPENIKWRNKPDLQRSLCMFGAVILLGLFVMRFGNEILSYTRIAGERNRLATAAAEAGEKEVVVPRVPENISNQRYALGYLNGQTSYDSIYYCRYYGIRIVIEEQ